MPKVAGYVRDAMGGVRCPTEICNSVCCKSSHFLPGFAAPCPLLEKTGGCWVHRVGGIKAKPWGCAEFPKNQADIDAINKQAQASGFRERCQLTVE